MPWRSRESREDALRMAVLKGTPLTGIGWGWESTGNRDWSSSGRSAGNGGVGGITGEVPCLFLPFPLHTPLYLLFIGDLCPAQCQAQGYYREKAQTGTYTGYVQVPTAGEGSAVDPELGVAHRWADR